MNLRPRGLALAAALATASAFAASETVAQDTPAEKRAAVACPNFVAWIKQHEAAVAKKVQPIVVPKAPALRDELLAMAKEDQRVRESPSGGPPPFEPLRKVDASNLPRIKAIVAEHGFPTRALVGDDGAGAAWLLVQHATAEPAFQAAVLKQITPRARAGDISGESFAMLTDRVLMLHEHRPQRYGSQLNDVRGKYEPAPIEDAAHVDERRDAVGMAPLADYVCFVNAMRQ